MRVWCVYIGTLVWHLDDPIWAILRMFRKCLFVFARECVWFFSTIRGRTQVDGWRIYTQKDQSDRFLWLLKLPKLASFFFFTVFQWNTNTGILVTTFFIFFTLLAIISITMGALDALLSSADAQHTPLSTPVDQNAHLNHSQTPKSRIYIRIHTKTLIKKPMAPLYSMHKRKKTLQH